MKKQVEYFDTDFLDNKIEIGDEVIIEEPKYRNFIIGTVVTKAPKSCQIEYKDFIGDTQITRQYYGQIIKYPIVKTGKWILESDEEMPNPMFKLVKCSVCDNKTGHTFTYCPCCGTLMNGGRDCE